MSFISLSNKLLANWFSDLDSICHSSLVLGHRTFWHSRRYSSCCSVNYYGKYQCKSRKYVFTTRCEQVVLYSLKRINLLKYNRQHLEWRVLTVLHAYLHHTFVSITTTGFPHCWFPQQNLPLLSLSYFPFYIPRIISSSSGTSVAVDGAASTTAHK